MKIKSYQIYLISMVAIGMICLPILGSAWYWVDRQNHSNEARWYPDYNNYPDRYGTSTAYLEVREKWGGSGYTGYDEIVSYSGSVYDSSFYIWKVYTGSAMAGRGDDSYLYCYITNIFRYIVGEDVDMLAKATVKWNDNDHSYDNIDFFEQQQ